MSLTRRSFFRTSSLLGAGMVISSLAEAVPVRVPANDRINVALIGCRGKGWSVLTDFLHHAEVRCVALCDVDENILSARGQELARLQNFQPELYSDHRKILERKEIDVVIIGTPDHWHCLQFTDACSAGKDVYVEKPISNSIAECDAMVAAAKRYGNIVQVGQQQRSGKHWQEMIRYIRSGKLGTIGHVHVWANFKYGALAAPVPDSEVPSGVDFDRWLGPAPLRSFNSQRFHGSWRMFWDYGGGLMTDWGVHLLDMGLWAMDVTRMPLKTQATGGKFLYPDGAHETFDIQSVSFLFDRFTINWEHYAGIQSGPYGRNYGILFQGTNGKLVANRDSWEIYPEEGKATGIKVNSDYQDPQNHVANFLECVKTRNTQTACTIENGSLCARYAHLGNIAARLGGVSLHYDDNKKKFDHSDADQYQKPVYRAPWNFPQI
jgi:predicted dehydrogenase